MITKEQAVNASEFHHISPRPNGTCEVWRRNGVTQTWKTKPTEFRVPVKWGLYRYGDITQHEVEQFYTSEECPNHARVG